MEKLLNFFKKTAQRFWDNILFLETLFLLAFIPLYPKLPLIDIKNTWVYIRGDDFAVVFVLLTWFILLLKKKVSLKTPLTLPILIYWLIGVLSTLHAVLLVFPTIANVFPNVAFLTYLRHIEYVSLFFVSFSSIKSEKQLKAVVVVLVGTLLGVIIYGFGQRFLGFPAFLTMNEQFAKGIPITLSALSRIPSTFGGQYDLAAYLVLIIPILAALFFGVKNWLVKGFLVATSFFGLILLFMTVSRVSFFVLFIGLFVVLFFQKRRFIFLAVPILLIGALLFLVLKPTILSRFQSTVSSTDVLVDGKTGDAIGNLKFVPRSYFQDKLVLQRRVSDEGELSKAIAGSDQYDYSSSSALFPFKSIPDQAPLVTAVNISTGENLPQGTGYTNLYLSPVVERVDNFFYELPPDFKSSPSAQVLVVHGDFIVKKAQAYDLSFTTRFQGEWPNAIAAFARNVFVGSGYSSVTLAVDNNYLRLLAETGILGFLSFLLIFMVFGIYARKIYPDVDSVFVRSFVVGLIGGLVALFLNAVLIDVFEASKIAYLLWSLLGITLGTLVLYQTKKIDITHEIKKIISSPYSIIILIFLTVFVVLSPMLNNFFAGDDFTWLRWVADCRNACSPLSSIINYFTSSGGFFYRPGTKIYFYVMYHFFWLNPVLYHLVSLLLHFGVSSLLYLLARKIFQSNFLGALAGITFAVLSGGNEAILWISSIGHLAVAFFGLLALLSFIYWNERKKIYFLVLSFISFLVPLFFMEAAVILPLLVPAYFLTKENFLLNLKQLVKRLDYLIMYIPVIIYLGLRFLAGSHWSGGDYSYNLLKLPFNALGNLFGYFSISIAGPIAQPIYTHLRILLRENLVVSILGGILFLALIFVTYRLILRIFDKRERGVIYFGIAFFVITLLPFLGLGNITSRYSYFAAIGLVLIVILLIKKIYLYLETNGKAIAIGLTSVGVLSFLLFHVISLQQAYFQWNNASNEIKSFFVSFEDNYSNAWSSPNAQFDFVNVPIADDQAWVFPVGLTDAVWIAIQNPNTKVNQFPTVEDAVNEAGLSANKFILVFKDDGSVYRIDRVADPATGQIQLIRSDGNQ